MSEEAQPSDSRNAWRLETPGASGWARSPHPGAENKYFMVSADSHACEPPKYMAERIEPEFRDRLPRVETRRRRSSAPLGACLRAPARRSSAKTPRGSSELT